MEKENVYQTGSQTMPVKSENTKFSIRDVNIEQQYPSPASGREREFKKRTFKRKRATSQSGLDGTYWGDASGT
tara:strand:+ start:514 stop:732 length:219 start_codon:yes stop_codon:yes gene_type:complete